MKSGKKSSQHIFILTPAFRSNRVCICCFGESMKHMWLECTTTISRLTTCFTARTKAMASFWIVDYACLCLLIFFERYNTGFSQPSSPAWNSSCSHLTSINCKQKRQTEIWSCWIWASTSWHLSDQTHFTLFLKIFIKGAVMVAELRTKQRRNPHIQESHQVCVGAWDRETYNGLNFSPPLKAQLHLSDVQDKSLNPCRDHTWPS